MLAKALGPASVTSIFISSDAFDTGGFLLTGNVDNEVTCGAEPHDLAAQGNWQDLGSI